MSARRAFEVDEPLSMHDALRMIRDALDDEGLALAPRSGARDQVTSVVASAGRTVFLVPATRIVTREEDAAMRAEFADQVKGGPE